MSIRNPALLLGVLLLGACSDSTGPAQLAPGTFEATVTGDFTASLEGAAFLDGGVLPENALGIRLEDARVAAETRRVTVVTRSRPGTATYLVGRPGGGATFALAFQVFDAAAESLSLNAVSQEGTITIDEATADVIRGSFDFTGVTAAQPARTVRVVGRFHALRPPAS